MIKIVCTIWFVLFAEKVLFARPIINNTNKNTIDPESYLRTYGYLTEENNEHALSMSSPSKKKIDEDAIKSFQRFMGLNVTGVIDDATTKLMTNFRCGVTDSVMKLRTAQLSTNIFESIWNKTLRTYRIGSFASYQQINRPKQESIIDDAFHEWAKYVPLTFEKVCETCPADIIIEFIDDDQGNHRDYGQLTRFEQTSLAHAAYPWSTYPTYIHFNKKVNFTESFNFIGSAANLFHVAVHEIGHTLGLDHVPVNYKSVMFSFHPIPYNGSRRDYLITSDQEYIQQRYGKREKSVISSCSQWSKNPQHLNMSTISMSDIFKEFVLKQRQWRNVAMDRISKLIKLPPVFVRYANKLKSSGGVIENRHYGVQSIFFDQFDNLYVSDYKTNCILKYETIANKQHATTVAKSLNAPRALYVSNDGNILYVVDNKGVHRFKLDRSDGNSGAATLLFQLETSAEIYTMIVDEADLNTIYLYDIARQRIQQCRHLINHWPCQTIIELTTIDSELTKHATIVIDGSGDFLLVDTNRNLMISYKHIKSECGLFERIDVLGSTTVRSQPWWNLKPVNNTIFILECRETNRVLDSNSKKDVYTLDSNGNNHQKWLVIRQHDGNYIFKNLATSLVLDGNNKKISIRSFHAGKSQMWKVIRQEDASFVLVNLANARVLNSNYHGDVYLNVSNGHNDHTWFFQMPSLYPYNNMITILRNKQNNKVLKSDSQKQAHQVNYDGHNNQKWLFLLQKDGTYVLRNLETLLVLDLNKNKLFTNYFHNIKSQKWNPIRQQDGSYLLSNQANVVSLSKSKKNEDQKWFFQIPSLNPYDNMIAVIRNKRTNRILDNNSGKYLYTFDYNGNNHQKWIFLQHDDESYVLENRATGLVLDSTGRDTFANDFTDRDSQKWKLIKEQGGSYVLENLADSYILSSNQAGLVYPHVSNGDDYQQWFFESI